MKIGEEKKSCFTWKSSKNEVPVLKNNSLIHFVSGQQKACGTITLLKGSSNVIVDTGNPWDKDLILEGNIQHFDVPL